MGIFKPQCVIQRPHFNRHRMLYLARVQKITEGKRTHLPSSFCFSIVPQQHTRC